MKIDKVYSSTVRTNIDIPADLLKTERQWAKCGYVAKNDDCGTMLWSNCNCSKKYRYLHKDEVRPATAEELTEYFRLEKEKAARRQKEKRERLRLEKNRKEWRVIFSSLDSECWDSASVLDNIKAKNPKRALEIVKFYLDEWAAKYSDYDSDVPFSSTLKYRICEIFRCRDGSYREDGEYFYF